MNNPAALYPSSILAKTQLSSQSLTGAYAGGLNFAIDLRGPAQSTLDTMKLDSTHVLQTVTLFISYTTGTGETNRTLNFKIETGNDDSDLYQATTLTDSSGTITVNPAEYGVANAGNGGGTVTVKRAVTFKLTEKYAKISFKETAVTNQGVITVKTVVTAN